MAALYMSQASRSSRSSVPRLCCNNTLFPFGFEVLNKQNTCLMPASTPLQFANEMCDKLRRERKREGLCTRKGGMRFVMASC